MAVITDHSGNLPRKFEECPNCHKKGYHWQGPRSELLKDDSIMVYPAYMACRYCKWYQSQGTAERMTLAEYRARRD